MEVVMVVKVWVMTLKMALLVIMLEVVAVALYGVLRALGVMVVLAVAAVVYPHKVLVQLVVPVLVELVSF
jgi:hypothetical protein